MTNNVSTDILSLAMAHMTTPDTVPLRSTVFNLEDWKINNITEKLQTGQFNQQTLANDFGSVGRSSLMAVKEAEIIGGWKIDRYSYILKLKTVRIDGSEVTTFVFGYTNNDNISVINERSANIAPDTLFIINTIVEEVYFAVNGQLRLTSTATYNVVRDSRGRGSFQIDQDQSYLLRPEDVVTNIQIGESGRNGQLGTADGAMIHNSANLVDVSANAIDKKYDDINTHFVDTLSTLVGEHNKHAYSDSIGDALIDAKCSLLSHDVYSNPFVEILTSLDNSAIRGEVFLRTEFTISDLFKIEGNVNNVGSSQSLNNKLHITGKQEILVNGIPVNSLDPLQLSMVELSIAYDVTLALSRIMWAHKLTELKMVMTNDLAQANRHVGMAHNVEILNMFGSSVLNNGQIDRTLSIIDHELRTVVFPQVCPPGHKLTVTVDAMFYGFIGLSIKLENHPIINVGLPIFADNTLTRNVGDMDMMNNMFGSYSKIYEGVLC